MSVTYFGMDLETVDFTKDSYQGKIIKKRLELEFEKTGNSWAQSALNVYWGEEAMSKHTNPGKDTFYFVSFDIKGYTLVRDQTKSPRPVKKTPNSKEAPSPAGSKKGKKK